MAGLVPAIAFPGHCFCGAGFQNEMRGHEPPLLISVLCNRCSDLRQRATSVPTRLGAWPTGITALIFIAAVSIAVTELPAALET